MRSLHLDVLAAAALGGDDHASVQETIGDLHRLIQQSAGIVAQIEDQAGDLSACFRPQRVERLAQVCVRPVLERLDLHIRQLAIEELSFHGDQPDHVAHERKRARFRPSGALRLHRHLGARRAHQRAHRLRLAPAVHGASIDLDQPIARLEPGARGGSVVDRRHHHHVVAARGELQADAAVFALGLLLEGGVRARVHEARVRIQGVDHAVDGSVDQLRLVHRFDVVILDQREHVTEYIELPVGARRIARGLCDADRDEAAQHGARAEHEEPLHFAAPPLAPASSGGPLCLRDSHCSGSSGFCPSRNSKYR